MTTYTLAAMKVGPLTMAVNLTCLADETALVNKTPVKVMSGDRFQVVRRLGFGNTTTLVLRRNDRMYRIGSLDGVQHDITLVNAPHASIHHAVRRDCHMQFDIL